MNAERAKTLSTVLIVSVLLLNVALLIHLVFRQVDIEKHGRAPAPAPATRMGAIVYVSGRAYVMHPGAVALKPIQKGAVLFSGDHIQTGTRSRVRLRFDDGTLLEMGPESLLAMPGQEDAEEQGMLHLARGNVEISGTDSGADVTALKTPQAVIRLNARRIVLYHPGDYASDVDPGHSGRDALAYLQFLEKHWLRGDDVPAGDRKQIRKLVAAAEKKCAHTPGPDCAESLNRAWQSILEHQPDEPDKTRLNMAVAVNEKSGREDIDVKQGAVRVDTSGRALTLTHGDSLRLEQDTIPVQPGLSENAERELVAEAPPPTPETPAETAPPATEPPPPAIARPVRPHVHRAPPPPAQKLYPKIESMEWQ